jgi:hypothetical protein
MAEENSWREKFIDDAIKYFFPKHGLSPNRFSDEERREYVKKRIRGQRTKIWRRGHEILGPDGKVRQAVKSGGKVYASHNKRYAHGGKVSGRKAKYNG